MLLLCKPLQKEVGLERKSKLEFPFVTMSHSHTEEVRVIVDGVIQYGWQKTLGKM
jgi:hypothetical protein